MDVNRFKLENAEDHKIDAIIAVPLCILKKFPEPAFVLTNIGILKKERLAFDGASLSDAFMTGSVKEIPALQLAVCTFDEQITLTINLRGSETDKENINEFLEVFLRELP